MGVRSWCTEGFMLPQYCFCKKNICLRLVFIIFVMCQVISESPPLKVGAHMKTLLSGDKWEFVLRVSNRPYLPLYIQAQM